MQYVKSVIRPVRRWVIRKTRSPRIGSVNFGDLAGLEPVSRDWGFDRGTPVDRYYIEQFLSQHSEDVRGRVLEIGNNAYTVKFGGQRVSRSDILQPVAGDPKATLIADLGTGEGVPDAIFDCIICTQTLQLIYDTRKALTSLHQMLRPGGILLLSVPGISQISREDMDKTGDYWRFTTESLTRLLGESYGDQVIVEHAGNVYAATALLQGIAVEELDLSSLDIADPQFQVMLFGRAVRHD